MKVCDANFRVPTASLEELDWDDAERDEAVQASNEPPPQVSTTKFRDVHIRDSSESLGSKHDEVISLSS